MDVLVYSRDGQLKVNRGPIFRTLKSIGPEHRQHFQCNNGKSLKHHKNRFVYNSHNSN